MPHGQTWENQKHLEECVKLSTCFTDNQPSHLPTGHRRIRSRICWRSFALPSGWIWCQSWHCTKWSASPNSKLPKRRNALNA